MAIKTLEPRWILQICHGYDGPFLDCARQYASLFIDTPYKITTVFLTGSPDPQVELGCGSDEVFFLNYSSKQISGLKLKAISRIRHIAHSHNFSLCISHRFKPTYIACLATNLPVIGINHAFSVYQRRSRKIFAHFFKNRLRLLAVSNAVRDDIRHHLTSWPNTQIETLYNRINIEAIQTVQLSRNASRIALELPPDAYIVGNVGRLHPDKDQATLIKGFAQALKDLPKKSLLVIMGSGRLEQNLKDLAHQLKISKKVIFLGQVANGRSYFKAFDIFALSSDHEPFGMVILEAMAAGVPIISSACGGAIEIINNVGETFPLGDSKTLATQLVAVSQLDQNQVNATITAMDHRLRNNFSDQAITDQFWQLPMINSLPLKIKE
ncbi:MAG: glycosyl transferase [Desulfobacteraceae bacterium 4572_35.1]|nr:MAG: glycosyl transferase [Desulfobacteraceae bacterium 4572_35.1]